MVTALWLATVSAALHVLYSVVLVPLHHQNKQLAASY